MKKVVKILAMVTLFALVAGMFAGCASQPTNQPTDQTASQTKFPTKQITVVVPYAPGGASDTVARIYAKELEGVLKVPVVVTNKTGASGAVGLEFAKNSKADGYTIAYMPVESTMIKALGFTELTTDDFKFLARVMTIPAAVTVHKDAKWNTLEELLKDAAANPDIIKVGNSGTGSIWHIAATQLEQASGAKFTHVPFDGAAPAIAALMGKNIDVVTVSPSEVKAGVDSGDLKVLAVLGDKASSIVPDVKLAKDMGYNVVAQGWGGFAVPKDTPDDIVKILEDASKIAIDSQTVKDLLAERGFEYNYLNAADANAYAKSQLDFYLDLIPKLGIKK